MPDQGSSGEQASQNLYGITEAVISWKSIVPLQTGIEQRVVYNAAMLQKLAALLLRSKEKQRKMRRYEQREQEKERGV